jgi:hypothetical protein
VTLGSRELERRSVLPPSSTRQSAKTSCAE